MKYHIEYALACHTGKIRSKNQDNFWCQGEFLDSDNDGLKEPLTGTADRQAFPVFAVFDGMGGEQQGEVAAYIAANTFDAICKDIYVCNLGDSRVYQYSGKKADADFP